MQETGNSTEFEHSKTIIRVAGNSISLSTTNLLEESRVAFEPYKTKNGISKAANLRDILAKSQLAKQPSAQALLFVDTPVILVPIDEFEEKEAENIYNHTAINTNQDTVDYNVLPELNCVAIYSVNKDLKNVVNDNFKKTRTRHILISVWTHFYKKSHSAVCKRTYCYFENGNLNIFTFAHNRFKFCNTFPVSNATDAAYYILYVWQQLAINQEKDELYLIGNMPEAEKLTTLLRQYIGNMHLVAPKTEVNATLAGVNDMPFDLMLYHTKGK